MATSEIKLQLNKKVNYIEEENTQIKQRLYANIE